MATKKKAAPKARRKKPKVNKSQAVRDYLGENPGSKPKEVSEELGKQGIDVSPQAVSTIKFQANKKGDISPARRGRPTRSGGAVDIDTLVEAKRLADKMGGVEKAKQALDLLAKLR